MKEFLLYKEQMTLRFKRMIGSGGSLFGKYKNNMAGYIRYLNGDFDKNLEKVKTRVDLNNINLENIFPTKYKWMVKNVNLKSGREYLKNLESRMGEFNKPQLENNLSIVLSISFLRFVLTCKIVETYLLSLYTYVDGGGSIDNLSLDSIGIDKAILKRFEGIEELSNKTIDEWLVYKCDAAEFTYFQSAMKRVLVILLGDEKGVA